MRRHRRDPGALILPEIRPEIEVVNGRVKLVRRAADSPAQLIHDELTALANALAGAYCVARNIPAVFRVAPPVAHRIAPQPTADEVLLHEQRKSLPRTTLQLTPGRHHQVGWDTYSTIGRPIHRCEDLLMHTQLASYLLQGKAAFSVKEMERDLADAAWHPRCRPPNCGVRPSLLAAKISRASSWNSPGRRRRRKGRFRHGRTIGLRSGRLRRRSVGSLGSSKR